MKINNLTPFKTEQLRAIAQRVAEEELDPESRNGITVHFVTAKSRTVGAKRARWVSYTRRTVGPLPPRLRFNQAIVAVRRLHPNPANTALLLAHEFAEMRGMDHRLMRTPRYFFRGNWREFYAWAAAMPLDLAEKPPKPMLHVIVNAKLENAEKRLAKALTREKRAHTIRMKWQRRVAYYQKRAVTITAPTEEPTK